MLRKSLWLPNQQPNFPVEVDCSDPLTRGMRGAFTSQGFMRDAFNAVQAASDNSTPKRTLSGAQRDYASLQRTTFPNRADYGLSSASTVVVIADVDTLTDYGALISCQNTTTTNGWELRLGNTATDSRIISHRANTSERQFAASAGNLIAAGSRRNFISVSYPNSSVESVPTFNVNGVSYTGSATVGSATGPFTASTAQLAIGARLGGTTSLDGAVLFAGLWSRVLSFSELESIRLNPWKIFRPKSSRALVAVSGGGATLSGDPAATSTATGSLTTSIPLAGAALGVSAASGQISTAIPLGGNAASVSVASGALSAVIQLSGTAVATAAAAANLTAGGSLSGAAQALASGSADLTIQIRLSGDALSTALSTGGLTTGAGLSGAALSQSAASGALTTAIPLTGAALTVSGASGNMTSIIQLAGVAASVSSAIGSLDISIRLNGAAVSQALAGGDLTARIQFDGAAVAQAAASGALSAISSAPTPIERTLRVAAENRTLRVAAENRTLRVAA